MHSPSFAWKDRWVVINAGYRAIIRIHFRAVSVLKEIMSDIDDKILEALNAEDKEVMDVYDEELGLFDRVVQSFRGKLRAAVIMVFLFILIFAAILVYSAINFFSVEDVATNQFTAFL